VRLGVVLDDARSHRRMRPHSHRGKRTFVLAAFSGYQRRSHPGAESGEAPATQGVTRSIAAITCST
jgi:hypothetical protein